MPFARSDVIFNLTDGTCSKIINVDVDPFTCHCAHTGAEFHAPSGMIQTRADVFGERLNIGSTLGWWKIANTNGYFEKAGVPFTVGMRVFLPNQNLAGVITLLSVDDGGICDVAVIGAVDGTLRGFPIQQIGIGTPLGYVELA